MKITLDVEEDDLQKVSEMSIKLDSIAKDYDFSVAVASLALVMASGASQFVEDGGDIERFIDRVNQTIRSGCELVLNKKKKMKLS